MAKQNEDDPNTHERRGFLRAGGLGMLAVALSGLFSREGVAAEVQFNRADLVSMNKKLRESASERQAFYANPQAYMERHGVRLAKDMIPSRTEVEAALKAKPGSAMRAITSPTSSRAMPACLVVCTPIGGASPAQMQSAPMKKMR